VRSVQVRTVRIELVAGAMVPAAALLAITAVRFGLGRGLAATSLFVLSLLAHEAGHFLIAKLNGTRCSAIGFCFRGAYLRRERASGAAEIAIAAAGPLVNIAIAAILWREVGLVAWLAQMNAVLAFLNLVPFRGSDGQRIMANLRELRRGQAPALREKIPTT
jgi:Zn-dependent protease